VSDETKRWLNTGSCDDFTNSLCDQHEVPRNVNSWHMNQFLKPYIMCQSTTHTHGYRCAWRRVRMGDHPPPSWGKLLVFIDQIYFNYRNQSINSIRSSLIMSEKLGYRTLLRRVLLLLWHKWPQCLSEKRNPGWSYQDPDYRSNDTPQHAATNWREMKPGRSTGQWSIPSPKVSTARLCSRPDHVHAAVPTRLCAE